MTRKALLFDLDGVVVDTETQYTGFWHGIGARFIPDDPDFALRVKGQTLTYIFDTYFPDEETRHELVELLDRFEREMTYEYIPGVVHLLKELKEAGIKTAVVTSSNRAKMANLYRARPELPDMFTLIRTAEDAGRSKPAPDGYIAAAHALGYEPEECVVLEDSLNGLKAGRASGAAVVGVATSLTREAITPLSDMVIDNFEGCRAEDLLHL